MSMMIAAAALLARVTVLVPRDGMQKDFEAGYKRHLEWHRGQKDPWTWLGWTVVSGERFGTFVDATIDRTGEELDAPVAPAQDAEDNVRNVLPYASLESSSYYRMRPDLGSGKSDSLTSPLVAATYVRVRPGREAEFESELRKRNFPGVVMQLASGGSGGSYVLLRGGAKASVVLAFDEPIRHESIESTRSEVMRYRADLTYFPEPR